MVGKRPPLPLRLALRTLQPLTRDFRRRFLDRIYKIDRIEKRELGRCAPARGRFAATLVCHRHCVTRTLLTPGGDRPQETLIFQSFRGACPQVFSAIRKFPLVATLDGPCAFRRLSNYLLRSFCALDHFALSIFERETQLFGLFNVPLIFEVDSFSNYRSNDWNTMDFLA